jgi:murein DD-endopeptidase MepM/ murein hydrolase activator NlpD
MALALSSSRYRTVVRVAAASVAALLAAGCSSGERFASGDPFSNPFNDRSEYTGSVSGAPMADARGSVTSEPLPPVGGNGYGSPQTSYNAPQQSYGNSNSGYFSAPNSAPSNSYASVPQQTAPQSLAPLPNYGASPSGSEVVVRQGDTLRTLSQRYRVTEGAIRSANNLPAGSALMPGQRLTIPASHAMQASAAPTRSAPVQAARSAPSHSQSASAGGTHVVQSGETLYSIARTLNVPVMDLAQANGVGLNYHVRSGEALRLPGANGAQVASAAPAQMRSEPEQQATLQPAVAKPAQAPVETTPVALTAPEKVAAPVKAAVAEPAKTTPPAEQRGRDIITADGQAFRWPVRGRVISGFGPKPNGNTNDGINLSVPEGTPIQAAADGVVAYAGNELKGYGNLVLIRHANGWVTAYAHNSQLLVKRGEEVRRGQVIAKAGKSGNVSSPQLHFEVRRGATPVDPLEHLPTG